MDKVKESTWRATACEKAIDKMLNAEGCPSTILVDGKVYVGRIRRGDFLLKPTPLRTKGDKIESIERSIITMKKQIRHNHDVWIGVKKTLELVNEHLKNQQIVKNGSKSC
jgi:hypothetical protein